MATAVSADNAKRALLERLVDDASLFPPAGLPMRLAVRGHARHDESAYWWVGGRFVVPASRLDEFAAVRADEAEPIALSVILDGNALGAKGDTVRADLDRAERVGALPGITVASFEARLPQLPLDEATLLRVAGEIAARFAGGVSFWYESAYDGAWATAPDAWLGVVAAARASAPANVALGAKVRCAGAAASATPSVDDLAAFVVAAQAHDAPWKATAGLHHPIRGAHGEAVVQHGFVNLFFAGVALHAGVLDAARVVEVLAEDDSRAFVVDPTHLAWKGVRVEAAQVAAARERCVSFGSCSFDEPVNDLRELGILS